MTDPLQHQGNVTMLTETPYFEPHVQQPFELFPSVIYQINGPNCSATYMNSFQAAGSDSESEDDIIATTHTPSSNPNPARPEV
jgi:hypothetical protein